MLQTGKVKDAARKVRSSVLAKITIAFVVFTLILNLAQNISVSVSRNKILGHFFESSISEKMQISKHIRESQTAKLENYAQSLTEVYPQIPSQLRQEDFNALIEILRADVKLRRYQGFVLADKHCDLICTSYGGYTQTQLASAQDLMRYVANNASHSYSGFAEVMDKGIGVVVVRQIRDDMGQPAATLVLCQAVVEDDAYLAEMGRLTQTQMSLYRNNVIAATSYDGHDVDIHGLSIPNEWVADSLAAGGRQVALTEMAGQTLIFSSYTPVTDHRGKMIGICHAWMDLSVLQSISRSVIANTLTVTVALDAVLILLVFLFMRRNLSAPLTRLANSAMSMASGDLTGDVEVRRTGDEVECLGEAMTRMQESLRESVGLMRQTAMALQKSSAEMSRTSTNMASNSSKQASSIEEISASIEEIASNVHQNADTTAQADKMISAADKFVASMASTSASCLNDTRGVANSLTAINDLVNQTTVLSLNASVEAARAGQAGMGFAVVAKEVGRLAEMTKRTATDTTATATKAIASTESIDGLVAEVIPQLHCVADKIHQLREASTEQTSSVDQINTAVGVLNAATQETAANADEMAERADEMAFMADRMEGLVNRFKA